MRMIARHVVRLAWVLLPVLGGCSESFTGAQEFPVVMRDVVTLRDMYGKIFGNDPDPLWLPCRAQVHATLTIQENGDAELEVSGPGHSTSVGNGLGGRDCSTRDAIPIGFYLRGVVDFAAGTATFFSCNNSGFDATGTVEFDLRGDKPALGALFVGEVRCVIISGNDPFPLGKPAMRAIIGRFPPGS